MSMTTLTFSKKVDQIENVTISLSERINNLMKKIMETTPYVELENSVSVNIVDWDCIEEQLYERDVTEVKKDDEHNDIVVIYSDDSGDECYESFHNLEIMEQLRILKAMQITFKHNMENI